jgi:hypothetical protein
VPVARLNNAAVTSAAYTDALTVDFGRARPSFSLFVFNAGVFYQLALYPLTGGDVEWEPGEHYLAPSNNTFRDPAAEGFPAGRQFGGVRVRAANATFPARVTVA